MVYQSTIENKFEAFVYVGLMIHIQERGLTLEIGNASMIGVVYLSDQESE